MHSASWLAEHYELLIVIDSILWIVCHLKHELIQLIDFSCRIVVLMNQFKPLFHLWPYDFLFISNQSVNIFNRFNMIDQFLLNHCLLRCRNSNFYDWLRVCLVFISILLLNCLMLSLNILVLCDNIYILAMNLTDLYQWLQIFLDHQELFNLFLFRSELLIALLFDSVLLMAHTERNQFNRWRNVHHIADFLDLLLISHRHRDRQASLDDFLLRITLSLLRLFAAQ